MSGDLFSEEKPLIERAKRLLRDMPGKEGYLLGCISYTSRKLEIPYSQAWQLLDTLSEQGFITPADDHGRRTLRLEYVG